MQPRAIRLTGLGQHLAQGDTEPGNIRAARDQRLEPGQGVVAAAQLAQQHRLAPQFAFKIGGGGRLPGKQDRQRVLHPPLAGKGDGMVRGIRLGRNGFSHRPGLRGAQRRIRPYGSDSGHQPEQADE